MPGVYIYAKLLADGDWSPIYIAQTRDLHQRLEGHVTVQDAIANGATHLHAHYSTAGQGARCTEEKDLIRRWQPVCNDALAKLTWGRFANLFAVDGAVEVPIQVLQRFDMAKPGEFDETFQLALLPYGQLIPVDRRREPIKYLKLADRTGMVEAELFARQRGAQTCRQKAQRT